MAPLIFIATEDDLFAETLCSTIGQWRMSVMRGAGRGLSADEVLQAQPDMVLLDIRNGGDALLKFIRAAKEALAGVQVLLINRTDNIPLSIEAMQAGADDEIMAPCESGVLRRKLNEAWRRRRKVLGCRPVCSLLDRFSNAMAAATFAQAGEFEVAVEIYRGSARNSTAGNENAMGTDAGRTTGPTEEEQWKR